MQNSYYTDYTTTVEKRNVRSGMRLRSLSLPTFAMLMLPLHPKQSLGVTGMVYSS